MLRFSLSKWCFSDLFSQWVHPTVPVGTRAHDSHARFIGMSLVAGAGAIAILPVLLILEVTNSALGFVSTGSLISLLAVSGWVSRSGHLENGRVLALLCLAVFLTALCLQTGGRGSPFLVGICILPIEAVLWRCNRGVVFGTLAALATLVAVLAFDVGDAINTGGTQLVEQTHAWSVKFALIYVALAAFRVHNFQSTTANSLGKLRNQFDFVSENSDQLLTQHDRNGSTLFVAGAARPLLGVNSKELLGNGLFERIHLQDRIAFLKSISDAAQLGRQQKCKLRIRFKGEGPRLWKQVEAVCRPTRDETTGHSNIACSMSDISDQVELQASLDQSLAKADEVHHAQRRFLATMSHELRTPLNAIVGFSDILHQDLFGKLPYERHQEYVSIIQDSGQHLLNVVNDLLDISRIEAGKYEMSLSTFPLAKVADATVKMLEPVAQKGGVNVQINVDETLPEITADRRACQQILINVISNAIKFTPDGGAVHVSARQFGRHVKLVIKDTGIGIPPDFLDNIGQPFVQVDSGMQRKFEGTGLGLSIVKGLVDLHRGELQIQSVEGNGTTVTIKLPVKATVSQPVPGDNVSQLVHLNKKTNGKLVATKSVSSSVNKGDRRARISA